MANHNTDTYESASFPARAAQELQGIPRRFVLRLIHGDLMDRHSECIVINHYAGLGISGAAKTVDHCTDGLLSSMAVRGVFNTQPGTVSFVPALHVPTNADAIAVLSMGEYERFVKQGVVGAGQFTQDQLRIFGHNVAKACCDTNLRDVASTVHGIGDSIQIAPEIAAHYFLAGYFQALDDCAKPGQTYFLTLVEIDETKIAGLHQGILNAIESGECGNLEVVQSSMDDEPNQNGFTTVVFALDGAAETVDTEQHIATWTAELDILMAAPTRVAVPHHLRLGALLDNGVRFKLSTIGTGSADQVIFDEYPNESIDDTHAVLEELHSELLDVMAQLDRYRVLLRQELSTRSGASTAFHRIPTQEEINRKFNKVNRDARRQLLRYGRSLYNQLLNPRLSGDIRTLLREKDSETLMLRLDESTARIPWELLADNKGIFALTRQIGRQLELVGQVRQPLPKTGADRNKLRVFIVSNPTGDLPNVEQETYRILDTLYGLDDIDIQITAFFGEEAQRQYIVPMLNERYDVFHYAGHAFFNPQQPSESGLVLAGGDIFTADMMWSLPDPPGLIFFNGCESAASIRARENRRIGDSSHTGDETVEGINTIIDNHLVSELSLGSIAALLRAGTRNFIGTQWPVNDKVAAELAIACYEALAHGHTVGEALRQARQRSIDMLGFGHLSWASYVLYGSPWNRLLDGEIFSETSLNII